MRRIGSYLGAVALLLLATADAQTPDSTPGCVYNATPPSLSDKQQSAWQCDSSGHLLTTLPASAGTVKSVSVVTANGLSGTVATATTTPAITLSVGAINLSSATGLPISTGVSGLGTGVATLLGGNSSGTGGPAGTTSPTFTTPVLGAASATTTAIGGGTAITSSGPGGALTSAAFTAVGTSGATIPLLNTANTWTGTQTINSGAATIAGTFISTGSFGLVTFQDSGTSAGHAGIGSNAENLILLTNGVIRQTISGADTTFVGTISATIASAATTSAVCYNTSSGLFTYNATVGTCTVSTLASKDLVAPLSPQEGFDMVMAQEPWRYDLKPGLPTYTPGEQIGLVAEYVTDARIVASNPDGTRAGVRYEQYTAALTAAVKFLAARVEELERKTK